MCFRWLKEVLHCSEWPVLQTVAAPARLET